MGLLPPLLLPWLAVLPQLSPAGRTGDGLCGRVGLPGDDEEVGEASRLPPAAVEGLHGGDSSALQASGQVFDCWDAPGTD